VTTYRRFIETNDAEGETWSWWLQIEGNEQAIDRLGEFLAGGAWDGQYELGATADQAEVDVLVKHAEIGYYGDHNRVEGVLNLPEVLDDEFVSQLYKGGIVELFTDSEPSPPEVVGGR
jgi:hypothetical protein